MLILRRRAGQSIQIGDDVVIEILEIEGNRVKLGFAVPEGIPVMRREVLVVAEENRIAGESLMSVDPNSLGKLIAQIKSR